MINLKKLGALILAAAMTVSLGACGAKDKTKEILEQQPPSEQTETAKIRVAGLKGPTTMGMLQMLESDEYEFTLANTTDEIAGGIIKGEFDIAAVPVNLASVLYNKTEGQVQMLSTNVLNVLYIVEKGGDTIKTVDDLKGKTVLATSKGATPDFTLRYILDKNGINPDTDLTLDFKSEPSEVATLLMTGKAQYAMLPQPFVTTLMAQDENVRIALDLQELWSGIEETGDSKITTACVIVQKDFAEKNPEAVAEFMQKYEESTKFTNENVPEAAALCEKYGIIPKAALAEKAIPQCGIVYMKGDEMKTAVSGYLKALHEQNPQAVGGAIPGDDFFYAS